MSHPISQEFTLTDQQVIDLIATAVEHMGHGCLSYVLTREQRERHEGAGRFGAYSEEVAAALLAGEEVHVTDYWDYDEEGTLTLDGLLRGIVRRADDRGLSVAALLDDADVEDADCAVQYAIWDRIVLG